MHVWSEGGRGGGSPYLKVLFHSSHGEEIVSGHIYLHNICRLMTQPTPSFLSCLEGSIAVTGRDLAKGDPSSPWV